MNLLSRINHKLDAIKLYNGAEKIGGYELRVTGDIDENGLFLVDKEMLREWLQLAKAISTVTPVVYVTDNNNFEANKQVISTLEPDVTVGIHGIKHVHYSELPFKDYCKDIREEAKFSSNHRFPYLDCNLQMLQYLPEHFLTDSSLISGWMYPFKIGNMIEYPITPPTDTALRNKPITPIIIQLYQQLIKQAQKNDRSLTLLLHPNHWSVELLTHLSKQKP